jgi:Uma2 family endonuclease
MKPTGSTAQEPPGKTPGEETPRPSPILYDDLPVLYEDEGQEEMGESKPHTRADHILSLALEEHCLATPGLQVCSNMNVYYHPTDRRAYVSPDVMIVRTSQPLPERLGSYRLGPDRPPPILVIEILSRRSAQQQDLTNKPEIYASMGVAEYVLVDGTGELLPDRLLLKRRVDEVTWEDEQDRDGGVTSRLGFRILIEDDELPRVIHATTGQRYLRPMEAHAAVRAVLAEKQTAEEAARAAAEARRLAEERIRDLETELRRLRGEQAGGGGAR